MHTTSGGPRWRGNAVAVAAILLATGGANARAEPMQFQLGDAEPQMGYVGVAHGAAYDAGAGYGFEKAAPNRFSVKVPGEGNYRVTVTFGGDAAGELTVKAETRRLVVERAKTEAGQVRTASFVVNVRNRTLPGGGQVKLNDRELPTPTWDDKLSLEFLPDVKLVKSVEIEPAAADVVTVHLAGDSTVTDQANEPWCGWGQMLPRFFDEKVAVANHAESGRTLRSFRGDRRFDKVLAALKPGDYVFVQFGHNDMKEKGEGIGALTSYKKDLEAYVAAIKEKGATPVLVTPMYRRRFSASGQVEDSLGDYPVANRQVAAEQKLTLIDLHAMSAKLLMGLGPAKSEKAFVHYPANTYPGQAQALKDNTHFNNFGGYEHARCVVEAIRTSTLPLAKHLAADVAPFDPSAPDDVAAFDLPASTSAAVEKPEGS